MIPGAQSAPGMFLPRLHRGTLIGAVLVLLFWASPVRASLINRIVNLFVTVTAQGISQVGYRFFSPFNQLNPMDPWAPGFNLDLPSNTPISPLAFPPLPGQALRLRIALKSSGTLLALNRRFKLQFGKLAPGQNNCSIIPTWFDLGNSTSGADWRGFNMLMPVLVDGAPLTTSLLPGSQVLGTYEEQNPTSPNPLILANQTIEYDWSIQNNIQNNSLDGGSYCFRMVNENGTAFSRYPYYPRIALTQPFIGSSTSMFDKNLGGTMQMNNPNGTGFTFIAPPNYSPYSQSFDIHSFSANDFLDQVGGQPSGKLGAHTYVYQMNAERNDVATSSFTQNVTLRINYADSEVSLVDEGSLKIYKHDGNSWIAQTTTLDTANNKAAADVNSFSSFGLFGDPTPTPTQASTSNGGSGTSGGGGGGVESPVLSVYPGRLLLRGTAYPSADVIVLKDAQMITSTRAKSNGDFELFLSDISAGTHTFGLWAQDTKGRRSITYTFTVVLTSGAQTTIDRIVLPPTIRSDHSEVKQGGTVIISGQSYPNSNLSLIIKARQTIIKKVTTDTSGAWSYKLNTKEVGAGKITVQVQGSKDGSPSPISQPIQFMVGTTTARTPKKPACSVVGDLNQDCRINLVDFSIAGYWYKKPGLPQRLDLNQDGRLDLKDFSIIVYWWSG